MSPEVKKAIKEVVVSFDNEQDQELLKSPDLSKHIEVRAGLIVHHDDEIFPHGVDNPDNIIKEITQNSIEIFVG